SVRTSRRCGFSSTSTTPTIATTRTCSSRSPSRGPGTGRRSAGRRRPDRSTSPRWPSRRCSSPRRVTRSGSTTPGPRNCWRRASRLLPEFPLQARGELGQGHAEGGEYGPELNDVEPGLAALDLADERLGLVERRGQFDLCEFGV